MFRENRRPFLLGMNKGNVLFNNALNTFFIQLYGVGHKVKEREKKSNAAITWATLFN